MNLSGTFHPRRRVWESTRDSCRYVRCSDGLYRKERCRRPNCDPANRPSVCGQFKPLPQCRNRPKPSTENQYPSDRVYLSLATRRARRAQHRAPELFVEQKSRRQTEEFGELLKSLFRVAIRNAPRLNDANERIKIQSTQTDLSDNL